MLSLNEAIESRKFYVLEACVRALQPPIRTLRLFAIHHFKYVWQVAMASREQLERAGLTAEEIDAIVVELKRVGLRLRMRLSRPLRFALEIGCFADTSTGEYFDRAVPALLEYVQRPEVGERTRELIAIQADLSRGRIEEYRRKRYHLPIPLGKDRWGFETFQGLGIHPM